MHSLSHNRQPLWIQCTELANEESTALGMIWFWCWHHYHKDHHHPPWYSQVFLSLILSWQSFPTARCSFAEDFLLWLPSAPPNRNIPVFMLSKQSLVFPFLLSLFLVWRPIQGRSSLPWMIFSSSRLNTATPMSKVSQTQQPRKTASIIDMDRHTWFNAPTRLSIIISKVSASLETFTTVAQNTPPTSNSGEENVGAESFLDICLIPCSTIMRELNKRCHRILNSLMPSSHTAMPLSTTWIKIPKPFAGQKAAISDNGNLLDQNYIVSTTHISRY